MQLTMSLDVFPIQQPAHIIENNLWINVTGDARMVGFTQKVEISQHINDALQPGHFEDEDAYEQRLYDALWLAHHYLCLDQRSSFSFTFHFLQDDLIAGRFTEHSIRLRLENQSDMAMLGLLNDFKPA
jgi:hypothetical protein